MTRLLSAALFSALVAPAFAADSASEDAVRKAIQTLVPNASVEGVAESTMPGLYEVVVDGHIVYMSHDARFLVQGSLYDMANKTDVTEVRRSKLRAEGLATVGKDQRIVFAPEKIKHTVTVFTDIDCGYCRRLHSQMGEYNKLGIAIEYLFFPRAGVGSESFDKAVTVWCSDDRRKALTDAKAGAELDKKECPNPIESDYALGNRLGVTGTPMIVASDGSHVGGYVPPDQLLQKLDQLEQDRLAKAP